MSKTTLRGIIAMLAAVVAFGVLDATMKHLTQTFPPLQVTCLRGLCSIPFFLCGVAFTRQWRSLLPTVWIDHLIRGVLAIGMLWAFVYAVSTLSLGTAYGIFLCAPLLITGLSAVFLRERVGLHRWLAVVCGLLGVIIVLNPDSTQMATLAGLAAFVAALCYSISALMIRRLARTDSTLSIGLSFMIIVAVGTGIGAYPNWISLSGDHWPWLLTLGLSGAAGQYLIIYAFRSAPPSIIAPFEFTALPWGLTLDWLLWNTVPTSRMLAGAGVVIASGLYLIYRERGAHAIPRPLPDSGV